MDVMNRFFLSMGQLFKFDKSKTIGPIKTYLQLTNNQLTPIPPELDFGESLLKWQ